MGITSSLVSLLPASTQLNGVVPITVGLESSEKLSLGHLPSSTLTMTLMCSNIFLGSLETSE